MTEKKEKKKPFYDLGTYAITLNPDDSLQYVKSRNRMELFRSKMHEKGMLLKSHGIDYKFYIEISEGVVNGKDRQYINGPINRLHLHGYLTIRKRSSIKWLLLHGLRIISESCSVYISPVKDDNQLKEWLDYCIKQQKVINEECLSSKYDYTVEEKKDHPSILNQLFDQ